MVLMHLADWGQLDLVALIAVLLVDQWDSVAVCLPESLQHHIGKTLRGVR